ncbi:MAG: TrbI/VirB10 family protein [Blastomonas fulva]|uniref:TrbI/VirB10 family protein n=1 Tax=Blastomonas fulva TaxID=1550728 RepID=UPI004034E2C6
MTVPPQPDPPAKSPTVDADERAEYTPVAPSGPDGLRLGGDLPRVMRLSRKALATLGFVASLAIGGSLIYALQPKDDGRPENLIDTNSGNRADQVMGAPASYSDVPSLGTPVTEDHDRLASAQMQGGQNHPIPPAGPLEDAPPPPDPRTAAAEQARERAAQERDSARKSQLFLAASNRGGEARTEASTDPIPATGKPAGSAALTPAATASSNRRTFLEEGRSRRTESSERILRLQSLNVVQAGSIIPAALITGIRSDLPGQITAQVTQNVYDSPTGRILLIPQGSRLIGEYDSDVAAGQNRVLLAWDRLILPGGHSILLDRLPGADAAGMAGLEDRTDYHWGNMLKAALLSTLLGAGTELVANDDSDLVRAIRFGTQDTVNQTGRQVVQRQLNVPPTLTVRPGFALRIIVTRDLILEPFDDGASQ